MRLLLFVLFLVTTIATYAGASTAYVVEGDPENTIYALDLIKGTSSLVTTLSGGLTKDALVNLTTAYITTGNSAAVYRVNLLNGSSTRLFSLGGSIELQSIACASPKIAYAVGTTSQKVYSIDLTNGTTSVLTTLGFKPYGIALEESVEIPQSAYVTDFTNRNVYRINLITGNVSVVNSSTLLGTALGGIALANNTTAYVTSTSTTALYRVDLSNGNISLVSDLAISGGLLSDISLANTTTAYVTDYNHNTLYRVDLTTGAASLVMTVPGTHLGGIALVLQIETSGLGGNNLRFANYLNANASQLVLPLFALQSNIGNALEAASPTRNAIFTFVSQTTQLAFGQQLYDHFAQKRWRKAWLKPPSMQTQQAMAAQSLLKQSQLFVDSADLVPPADLPPVVLPPANTLLESDSPPSTEPPLSEPEPSSSEQENSSPTTFFSDTFSKESAHYFPWLGMFGEYTHERSQHQTPAFETGTGGFVLAMDYHRGVIPKPLLGGGIAYAYTHVHESDGMGHANINQGAAVAYGELTIRKWYTNWALWGGYYHAHNVRTISISGVTEGSATANTHGWQLTPHLEVGYDYEKEWFCVESFEMIDWVACWEEGFQESGTNQLNMGQDSRFCSLLRNEAGVRFNETLTYHWGTVTFREKGSYVYQKAFHTGRITAFLVGSSGSFVVSTLNGAQNLGVIEFESLFVPANTKYPYGTISSQVELGSHYQSYQGMVTIGMDF